jgi:hypothetical protein
LIFFKVDTLTYYYVYINPFSSTFQGRLSAFTFTSKIPLSTMPASSSSSNQPTLFDYHISSSFIDDSFSKRCQTHQSRPFLSVGVVPTVGMRVEVLMFLKRAKEDGSVDEMEEGETWQAGDMENKIRPFRLSGEIVEVRDPPSLER